ncbi:MAG: hypothetical protein EHM72_10230 [Calditrichaeota bacterium]|nr:MAG: hypothetical protein EHM72_10230 [Calditrichota bacterium]
MPTFAAGTTVWYRIQANDGSASAYLKAGNSVGGAYKNPLGQWVRNPDVSASDNYSFKVENPISIAMKTFSAQQTTTGVLIEWSTDSEHCVAGYNIKRSLDQYGSYTPINRDIILSRGTPSSGARYRFQDPDYAAGRIWYQIEQIMLDGTSESSEPLMASSSSSLSHESIVPADHFLLQNFPNPFNSNTTIRFDLQQTEKVQMMIYDLHGRSICTLLDEILPGGTHQIVWDGSDGQGNSVSSGMFLCHLNAGGSRTFLRMVLLK